MLLFQTRNILISSWLHRASNNVETFLILDFRRVLNVVTFL